MKNTALAFAGLALLLAYIGPAKTAEVSAPAAPRTSSLPEPEALASQPKGRNAYLAIVTEEAKRAGLPPEIADAVCQVESGYDPKAVGTAGEVGLMQVLPSTAAGLGFEGSIADLSDPKTNIRFGVKYLAQAWQLASGNFCRTLMKYRAGHSSEHFTQRSIDYCRWAREHLASIGAAVPGASEHLGAILGADAAAAAKRGGRPVPHSITPMDAAYQREIKVAQLQAAKVFGRARSVEDSSRFWRAQQAHIRAIEARLKKRTTQFAVR